ncbi:RluA family pseudouridine synthase [bacterium]|nr:RluA family pseudouridine synthase [bacterium]
MFSIKWLHFHWRKICGWYWTQFQSSEGNTWAIRVSYSQYRERLDTYLQRYWPNRTKGDFRQLIVRKRVRVNFRKVKPDYRVRKNDLILLDSKWLEPLRNKPVASPLTMPILYEDRYVLIVDKPAGLTVHHHFDLEATSVISELIERNLLLTDPVLDMETNVIHRLDKFTSGVLMVCRNYRDLPVFKKLFRQRRIHKEYRAVVRGQLPTERGEIIAPLRKDERIYPARMVVDHNYFRHAVTEYEVMARTVEASLVKIHLMTGRTHQIRVHFASIGHPVMGDCKYDPQSRSVLNRSGQSGTRSDLGVRLMLHAFRLQFQHPFTGQIVDISSPLPEPFRDQNYAYYIPEEKKLDIIEKEQ